MADEYKDTGGISWVTIKIKTLIIWTSIILLLGGGTAAVLYYKLVLSSPEKKATEAIAEAKSELQKLSQHDKCIPELLESPSGLLDEAEKAYKEEKFIVAREKAEESLDDSKSELERLIAAGAGHKSATFISIEGVVQVRKKGKNEWIEGKERMPLYAGDYIKTGKSSGAWIMPFDGSRYFIKENSLVLIEESYEDPATKRAEISIKIDDGDVNVSTVNSPIAGSSTTVSTPSAKTVFNEKADSTISYNKDKDETSVSLYTGRANLKVGDQNIILAKNEKINIEADEKISAKIKLLPSPSLLAPPHREIYEIEESKEKVISFSWADVEGAEEYALEVAGNQMFLRPITQWTKKTTLNLRGFDHGDYFWRVIASKEKRTNSSKPSDILKFTLRKKSLVDIDDKTPPPIDIYNAYPLGEYYLITGKTEPGATLTVNNRLWDLQSDGSFKDLIILKDYGINIIVFRSVDAAGNATVKRLKLEMK
jgi:hypothetical protein